VALALAAQDLVVGDIGDMVAHIKNFSSTSSAFVSATHAFTTATSGFATTTFKY
jgi:hypothetical protein